MTFAHAALAYIITSSQWTCLPLDSCQKDWLQTLSSLNDVLKLYIHAKKIGYKPCHCSQSKCSKELHALKEMPNQKPISQALPEFISKETLLPMKTTMVTHPDADVDAIPKLVFGRFTCVQEIENTPFENKGSPFIDRDSLMPNSTHKDNLT